MTFKDHFSEQSPDYARFRPKYPPELFAMLAASVPNASAWDCATGSGQAALGLAKHFERVYATDASEAQIRNATPHPRVRYAVRRADDSGLADRSIDLINFVKKAVPASRVCGQQPPD